jgi:predicted branched-subunit amino acid permease
MFLLLTFLSIAAVLFNKDRKHLIRVTLGVACIFGLLMMWPITIGLAMGLILNFLIKAKGKQWKNTSTP